MIIIDADQLQVKIPNSQLNAQPISNLTRNKVSRIKQKVRFTYDGLDKMPELIDTIKSEIKSSCPKLITNSRSRVYFNSFEVGYLEVVVNMKFNIRPRGSEYYACKNEVMYAIARAAKKCNVEFQTELE
jgi:small-conductance mechanosensitive channel